MKSFKEFNIRPEITSFTGDKIKIERVLNREIVVTAFKISPSKHQDKGNCLTLEFQMSGNKHILFTSGKILMQQIEKVPMVDFPFKATIIKENEYYEFT